MNLIYNEELSFPGLGITIDVSPVAFQIGDFKVYWYGVIIAAAMLVCFGLAVKLAKKNNFSPDLVYDLMFITLPCAIVGARVYYVIFRWDYYAEDLSRIFDTRSGGLAVYGGVILVLVGYFVMCRIRKIPYSTVLDYLAPLLPLGQAIGRWGNFFNQEAFGTTTNLPWGMTSNSISSYLSTYCPTLDSSMPVHPTFLYESLGNIILCIILFKLRKKSKYAYETAAVYFVGYGFIRFFVEGLRTDSLYIGSTAIRASQLLSLILVIGGLLYIAFAHYKKILRQPLPERFLVEKGEKESKVPEKGETEVPETEPEVPETEGEKAPEAPEAPENEPAKTPENNDGEGDDIVELAGDVCVEDLKDDGNT